MKNLNFKNSLIFLPLTLFLILTAWWFWLNPFLNDPSLIDKKYIWGSCYQIIAIVGGIVGIILSRSFGGYKSWLGKSILFFAVGLFLQSFGQTIYSYFNIFARIEAPYPSIGDIGYFGSVIAYIFGVLCLASVSGAKMSLKLFRNKMQAFLLPLILLLVSYAIFLRNYEFDWSNKLKIFLDFGYPLGQAFYVSIAVLILILTRSILGGMMKKPVVLILISLLIQYISDFYFLFQSNNGNWYVGGVGDFLYMTSYLMMTISLVVLSTTFEKIKNS